MRDVNNHGSFLNENKHFQNQKFIQKDTVSILIQWIFKVLGVKTEAIFCSATDLSCAVPLQAWRGMTANLVQLH